ncbi:prepilin-type N-terminal cleavage/methylation domain-containing protein [Legionella yabuuchiae]|uniref:prepilin-type N-terminal cleavage/methylation domain-containing protein n=1 Tax=Legionella yabuuchiae TaxID=376727 RepID=UPI001055986A|nr:prepilin-type N-terminal cleavage/methylation domain-containing protein [Legionella yabuuchiae]
MKVNSGFTLIEIILYIVVLSIVGSGLLIAFNAALVTGENPGKTLAASQLAKARMNIILQQRLVNGFNNISDPCATDPAPGACAPLATFATNNNLIVASSIPPATGGVRTATVTVSGAGNATVTMRFVQ